MIEMIRIVMVKSFQVEGNPSLLLLSTGLRSAQHAQNYAGAAHPILGCGLARGKAFASLGQLCSVLRRLGLQSRRSGEILSLALAEREAYSQNGMAACFGAQHLDGERGESCRASSLCDSSLLASFRRRAVSLAHCPSFPLGYPPRSE